MGKNFLILTDGVHKIKSKIDPECKKEYLEAPPINSFCLFKNCEIVKMNTEEIKLMMYFTSWQLISPFFFELKSQSFKNLNDDISDLEKETIKRNEMEQEIMN